MSTGKNFTVHDSRVENGGRHRAASAAAKVVGPCACAGVCAPYLCLKRQASSLINFSVCRPMPPRLLPSDPQLPSPSAYGPGHALIAHEPLQNTKSPLNIHR